MKFIRLNFLFPMIIVIALITVFNILFFDSILKTAFISTGEMIFGAKIEIDKLKTNFVKMSLAIDGLKCADKNDYFKNLIDIDNIRFDVQFSPLLRKKVVIDEMSVSGLKWNTTRKTSGQLPLKKEKKFNEHQKKDNKFLKLFDSAKKKTVSEFNALPSVTAFNEIQEQLKNFDINKIIDKSNLQSVKEIENLSSEFQNKYQNYKTKLDNINIEEKINKTKNLIDEISKTKISEISDISKVVKKTEELKNTKKEFDDILKELNSFKKDVVGSMDISKQIQNIVTKDVNLISSKLSLPDLNTRNISKMLFGQQWINKVDKIIYYMSVIKKYMPEKTETEKQVKERASGRDIIFKQTLYPTLLISKINITGTTAKAKDDSGIDFSGLIQNVSSSPDMVGKPITLELKGANNGQKINVEGLFDHRTKKTKDILKISLSGISGQVLNIPANDYLPLVDSADVSLISQFNLEQDGFDCNADITLKNIKEKNLNDIHGNIKYLAEITNSIKSFNVSVGAKSKGNEPLDLSVVSDIDKKLSDAISKLFSSKINDAKAKIKEEVNKMVKEQTKQLEDTLKTKKEELLKDINIKTKSVDDITKSISDAIKKSAKI